ncbi:caffeoylshikimate esterase [Phtheirospermum japonicum]|uniref:Caffeoylshikimate esterase n=1 Tax=Phtheirospermum japonicum TaxID=374723 RepID=A0A830CT61_9LAMI|nr:caffeoylshikimate esterase [Phtheirospermum japonicum]
METQMSNVKYDEEFIVNSRGVKLFTCRWVPTSSEPKALIFLCHGYGMECSISMRGCASRLVKAGYEVHGIDCEGHGKSSGLQGLISNFDDLVDDLSEHFTNISERRENRNKMRIIMGESMGGAMVLRLHRKKPEFWDGAVLIAPMCKIADDVRPSPLVIKILIALARIIPTWKLTPTPDIIDIAFRDPQVVKEVSLPFIVLHGEDDKVTDPSVSKTLYESAQSSDKTFKLYPGMWHSLSYGELPENLDTVFSDMVNWLDNRFAARNAQLEEQQKFANDNSVLEIK